MDLSQLGSVKLRPVNQPKNITELSHPITLGAGVALVLAQCQRDQEGSFDFVLCANELVQKLETLKGPGRISLGSFTSMETSVLGVSGMNHCGTATASDKFRKDLVPTLVVQLHEAHWRHRGQRKCPKEI